ncbi:MAG: hypothetical protein V2A76_05830 [Planctomycetota bacterium]
MRIVSALAWFAALPLVTFPVLAQEEAAPTPSETVYDLRVFAGVGKPIHVTVESDFNGVMRGEIFGAAKEMKSSQSQESEFVDEYLVLDEDVQEWTRTILRWYSEQDSVICDPELTGVRLHYVWKDGQGDLDTSGRMVSNENLDKLNKQRGSVGVWVPLPEEAKAGQEFAADMTTLLPLLMDEAGKIDTSSASFSLDSVDENQVAKLNGSLSVVMNLDGGGLPMRTVTAGDCVMLVDLARHQVQSIFWQGTTSAEAQKGAVELQGEGRFKVNLKVQWGPAVEKALKKRLTFRSVPRSVAALGLSFTAPSHWFHLDESDGVTRYMTGLFDGAEVMIEYSAFDVPSGQYKEFLKGVEDGVRENNPDMKAKGTSSPLGKGRAFEFEIDGSRYLAEMFPLPGDRMLSARCYAPASLFPEALKEYVKIRGSFRAAR